MKYIILDTENGIFTMCVKEELDHEIAEMLSSGVGKESLKVATVSSLQSVEFRLAYEVEEEAEDEI